MWVILVEVDDFVDVDVVVVGEWFVWVVIFREVYGGFLFDDGDDSCSGFVFVGVVYWSFDDDVVIF